MSTPLVSIIIPVYNAQRYIHQALDTLLSQSVDNIEIIAVDDGSTDKSLEILNRYAAKSKRMSVYTQKNQYAGVARNTGLKHAQGEYVLFLDSDDFFDKDLVKETYNAAKENDADIVLFGANYYHNQSGRTWVGAHLLDLSYAPQKQPFSSKDCPDTIFQISTACPWTKLFRREFLIKTGLQFQNLHNANDVFFVFSAIAMAERIVTLDKQLVNYRVGLKNNLQSSKKRYFYEAYSAWHDKLIETGLLETLRKSYTNCAMNGCMYNLRAVEDIEAKKIVFDMLKDEVFSKLEIFDYDKEYYYHEKNYREMLQVKNDAFDNYVKEQKLEDLTKRLQDTEKRLDNTEKRLQDLRDVERRLKETERQVNLLIRNKEEMMQRIHNLEELVFTDKKSLNRGIRFPRIIVSLTSFPARIGEVSDVIENMLVQTKKPDEIVLWLSKEQFPKREEELPKNLLKLKKCGVKIEWCDGDIKAYKKFIPALKKYPKDLIIIIDDDLVYPINLVEELYKAHKRFPNAIIASRVHEIRMDGNGNIAPYGTWKKQIGYDTYKVRDDWFFTGGAGTLLPPHVFGNEIFDEKTIQELCPWADDIWLNINAAMKNVPIVNTALNNKLARIEGTQEVCLQTINLEKNDTQLKNLAMYFREKLLGTVYEKCKF